MENKENVSQGQAQSPKRKKRKWIGVIIAVVCVVLINELLKFCLEPYGSASQVMWDDYHKEETIDQIFVGSSLCYVGISPYVVDDIMGTNSYNMGTPSQYLAQTKLAIKTAIEDHGVKRVVMALGYFPSQEKEAL